jgi:hypothetical protein
MGDFDIDHAGVREILQSAEVRAAVDQLAVEISSHVTGTVPTGTDIGVDSYTTDRAAASVTIRDAMGKLWQARDGVLTRAAAAAGIEVKAKSA